MPIAYIARTRERYAGYRPYKWATNDEAPWTPLGRPIRDCRLALVSSGGFHLRDQPPFHDNDASIRLIPMDAEPADLRIYHHGYRDDDADRDPNCVLPLARLRELASVGVIGDLAPAAVSFVTLYSARREVEERAPQVVEALRTMGADVALMVPV